MKKVFLILVAIIGLGIGVKAQCPCSVQIDDVTVSRLSYFTTYVVVTIKLENCDCSKIRVRVTPSNRISNLLETGTEPGIDTFTASSRNGYQWINFALKTDSTDYKFTKSDFYLEVLSKEQ